MPVCHERRSVSQSVARVPGNPDVGLRHPAERPSLGEDVSFGSRERIKTATLNAVTDPETWVPVAGALLLSVMAYSASAVAIKRIGADVPALAITIGGLLVAVPLLVTVFLLAGEVVPETVPLRAAWSIVYLGLIGSVLGFALYYYVLKHVEATRVALIALVTPVIALLLGNYLNGESIQAEAWIGTAAILSGLLLYEYGQKISSR
jgi:drug/metabolite transporter (DMT)-like permease